MDKLPRSILMLTTPYISLLIISQSHALTYNMQITLFDIMLSMIPITSFSYSICILL